MKSLTLYIDKWYIIAAVCNNGVPTLVKPSNRESRFWLYFYDGGDNDTVVYGKDNKQKYLNNTLHYYGDIFNLITDERASFIRYNRKQEMYKIFQASGILDELRESVGCGAQEKIDTYISYSSDISDASRLIFDRDVLTPKNFVIKESVARIGHLALEYAFRKERFTEDGVYLMLNACNENLSYSLYERKNDLLLRMGMEGKLDGMGADLRGRALLEDVVSSINKTNHFLVTPQDYEREYLYLAQYVDQWIIKLENAKPGRPISISNVSLSKYENKYDVTVLKSRIDGRTSAIVNDIVRTISDYVKNSHISNEQIKGVVFLGNTFTNSQFIKSIEECYTLDSDKYVLFKDNDLPSIVGVYSVIDCSQFSTETQQSQANGETELARQKIAREEEERRKKAEEERAKADEKNRKAKEAENKYQDAMANVLDFERRKDYAQMSDWADIALQHRPNDDEATKKKAEAVRLLSEQKVKEDQYKSIIQRASKSLEIKKWQDALSQSEAALNLMPESKEGQRIHEEARKQIETKAQIEKYLTRADMFLAQKLYSEAIEELRKVQSFDANNDEVKKRITKIEKERTSHEHEIESLIENYQETLRNKDYDKAIDICNKLIDKDSSNQRKWTERIESIKKDKAESAKKKKAWSDLNMEINSALFEERWEDVVSLGKKALEIHNDEALKANVKRAEQRLETKKAEEKYTKTIDQVKARMQDKAWDEAKRLLCDLQKEYPEHTKETKVLFARIFKEESENERKHRTNRVPKDKQENNDRPVKIKGFTGNPSKKKSDEAFFFDEPPKKHNSTPNRKAVSAKPQTKTVKPTKKTGDEFFDMDSSTKKTQNNDSLKQFRCFQFLIKYVQF